MISSSYKQSGVDIDAANQLVNKIKPLAKATSRTGSDSDLGGFGAIFDIKKCGFSDPVLVSSTDGVGTKLRVAIECNSHQTIGIDLVAMSVNDLVVQGAQPLFFLDYFACGKLQNDLAVQVIAGIAEGCKIAGCALIGGETAEMPGMYHDNDYDLAGFAVGAVERDAILPKSNLMKKGDILLGIASSGLHSNGYSLARMVIKNAGLSFDSIAFDQKTDKKTIGEILLTPTKIYAKSCLNAFKTNKIKGLAHITGGGLIENLPRILPKNLQQKIDFTSWQKPEIFNFLQKIGSISDHEMHRTFNCGIGMVAVVAKEDFEMVKQIFVEAGEVVYKIGELV